MGNAATTNMGMAGAASGLQGVSSLATAIEQAGAATAQAKYEQQQYKFNAKVADFQGEDAIRRGEKAANAARRQGRQVVGAQRAGYAAQGIDPNSGSAAEVQAQTSHFAELDALTIKTNAFREAFGYKVDAMSGRAKGNFARIGGDFAAGNTIATGGLQFAQYGTKAGEYLSKIDWGK